MRNLDQFFSFALERERIRKKKEAGEPKPWTTDPVLRSNFFCNIYREKDKVTTWFRENVRDIVAEYPAKALAAVVAFRWFNFIPTGETIKPWLLFGWHEGAVLSKLQLKRTAGEQIFGSAYIISSPYGDPKVEWAVKCASNTIALAQEILIHCTSLENAWNRLCDETGLGPFMAYEIVTDLRHTCVLRDAPDIMTWANPGPGCARGLGWLIYDCNKGIFDRSVDSMSAMRIYMARILDASREYPFDHPWEMREVEHTLCEYDKYRRGLIGSRLKRKYNG